MTGCNVSYTFSKLCQTCFTACIISIDISFTGMGVLHLMKAICTTCASLDGNGKCRSGFNSSRTCFVKKWENPQSVRTREGGWETRGFAEENPKPTSPCENYGPDDRWKLWPSQQISDFFAHFGCLHTGFRSLCSNMSGLYKSGEINKGGHPLCPVLVCFRTQIENHCTRLHQPCLIRSAP